MLTYRSDQTMPKIFLMQLLELVLNLNVFNSLYGLYYLQQWGTAICTRLAQTAMCLCVGLKRTY